MGDLLDLIIIALAIRAALRGRRIGFAQQAGALVGYIIGLTGGILLVPSIERLIVSPLIRIVIVIIIVYGVATALGRLGEYIGMIIARGIARIRLRVVDQITGAILGVVIVGVGAWLLAAIFARVPVPVIADELQRSVIVATLDHSLPAAPSFIASAEKLLANNGFPRVFAGLEPTPAAPVTGPNATQVNEAASKAEASTVQIKGLTCGEEIEGSGFVAAPGLVITNAHVVAGINHPVVYDRNGAHVSTPILFDPNLDIAVLRVTDLAGPALPLASSLVDRGAVGAVLGYPEGGPLTIGAAAVRQEQTATGRNIYDEGLVSRQIYELQAIVRPGNSGGPLVSADGTVVGVVFADSTTDPNIGYAIASPAVAARLSSVSSTSPAISTGQCTAD